MRGHKVAGAVRRCGTDVVVSGAFLTDASGKVEPGPHVVSPAVPGDALPSATK
jgi:hypothetical protein